MSKIYKLNAYLKEKFGGKVWKIPVEAGFSCPNRDGHKGTGGCIYCNTDSFDGAEKGNIADQVRLRAEKLRKRGVERFIVYFQSYSNTYGPLETVKARIEESLCTDGIVALHIGTRPDVIDDEKLEYFSELNKKYEVVIEYGLQSANDATLKFINRGHGVREFTDAVTRTHSYGIKTCAHLIFGLPGDTRSDMMKAVELLNSLKVHSVKFHHLHVVKGTGLAKLYQNGDVKLMSEDEYLDTLAEAIGRLDSNIVVARLAGDAAGESLIAPDWPRDKNQFERKLTDIMDRKGLVQGSLV